MTPPPVRKPRRIAVNKLPDDPVALRASIGGRAEIGYYLTYRGDLADIVPMLRDVLKAAEGLDESQVPRRPQG